MSVINHKRPIVYATTKQINYLNILFCDCGFVEGSDKSWLSAMFNRKINAIGALSIGEAIQAIDKLKEIKENQKNG